MTSNLVEDQPFTFFEYSVRRRFGYFEDSWNSTGWKCFQVVVVNSNSIYLKHPGWWWWFWMVMEKEQNFSEIEIAAIRFCLKHNNTTVFVQTMEALTQNITMVGEACARVSSFSFKYKKFPSQRCNVHAILRDFVFLRKSTRFFAKWQRWKCNCDPRRYSIIITWRCQTVHWMICFVKNQRCSIITQECTVLYK